MIFIYNLVSVSLCAVDCRCALLDFGNLHFGNALSDISFFIATNVTIECRRQHETAIVRHYHDCLIKVTVLAGLLRNRA